MNPMNNLYGGDGLSPQLQQNIQQVKNMMRMANGDPNALLQQNPMLSQVMQMTNGKNPRDLFYSLARQRGVDPDKLLKELKS